MYTAERRRQGCHSDVGCAVVLVPETLQNRELLGSMTQRIIAQPYRGRTLRISAWLRVDARALDDSAQLWVGVERPNDIPGLHDEVRVRSSSWQCVQIAVQIDDDANYINIALVAAGRGNAWMDGVMIEEIQESSH